MVKEKSELHKKFLSNEIIEFNGERNTIRGFAEKFNINPRTLYSRLRKDYTIEEIFAKKIEIRAKRGGSENRYSLKTRTDISGNREMHCLYGDKDLSLMKFMYPESFEQKDLYYKCEYIVKGSASHGRKVTYIKKRDVSRFIELHPETRILGCEMRKSPLKKKATSIL